MQHLSSHTSTWEYQDVYLQFLQLFEEEGEEAPAAKSATRSKKDRHSKINTLRGPRDRRMRLSLDIARRFFHLQDLLGYDKASTTVQWLLTNAGAAIADLEAARGHQLSEHSSTCDQADAAVTSTNKICRRREKEKVKRVAVERESRRMARERARERTSQKRRLLLNNTSYTQTHVPNYEDLKTEELWRNKSPCFTYDTFFTQDEQIPEFEFGGKPWEAFNSFQTSI